MFTGIISQKIMIFANPFRRVINKSDLKNLLPNVRLGSIFSFCHVIKYFNFAPC